MTADLIEKFKALAARIGPQCDLQGSYVGQKILKIIEEHEAAQEAEIAELRDLIAGYEHWASDVKRLTRALDVELHGDDAAPQASLCDLVGSIREFKENRRALTVHDAAQLLWAAYKELRGKEWKDCTEVERDIKTMDSAGLRAIAEGRPELTEGAKSQA